MQLLISELSGGKATKYRCDVMGTTSDTGKQRVTQGNTGPHRETQGNTGEQRETKGNK